MNWIKITPQDKLPTHTILAHANEKYLVGKLKRYKEHSEGKVKLFCIDEIPGTVSTILSDITHYANLEKPKEYEYNTIYDRA